MEEVAGHHLVHVVVAGQPQQLLPQQLLEHRTASVDEAGVARGGVEPHPHYLILVNFGCSCDARRLVSPRPNRRRAADDLLFLASANNDWQPRRGLGGV